MLRLKNSLLKQFLCMLLAVCLIIAVMPVSYAADDEKTLVETDETISAETQEAESFPEETAELETLPESVTESEPVKDRSVAAPLSYDNESSQYDVVLGQEGVTSGYAALDTSEHEVGTYKVGRTYILRFQDDSFSITNSTGARIDKSAMITISGSSQATIGFAVDNTYSAGEIIKYYKSGFFDSSLLSDAGYTPDSEATDWYYFYLPENVSQTLDYAVLIEITPHGAVSEIGAARQVLKEQIDRVTGACFRLVSRRGSV